MSAQAPADLPFSLDDHKTGVKKQIQDMTSAEIDHHIAGISGILAEPHPPLEVVQNLLRIVNFNCFLHTLMYEKYRRENQLVIAHDLPRRS